MRLITLQMTARLQEKHLDPKHTAGSGTGRDPGLRAADQSCLRTAWPLRVSTLKLLVLAGMMKKATTVCSLPFTWDRGEGRKAGSHPTNRQGTPAVLLPAKNYKTHFLGPWPSFWGLFLPLPRTSHTYFWVSAQPSHLLFPKTYSEQIVEPGQGLQEDVRPLVGELITAGDKEVQGLVQIEVQVAEREYSVYYSVTQGPRRMSPQDHSSWIQESRPPGSLPSDPGIWPMYP